jgi:hypothetical protein
MVSSTDPRHRPHSIEGLTKPDPREYASQIVAWAICWPWNLVWTLCVNNPFRYLIEFAFLEIRAAFDEISSGQFESIEKDLLLDDSPAPETQPAYQTYEQSAPIAVPPPVPVATMQTQVVTKVESEPATEAARTVRPEAVAQAPVIVERTTQEAAGPSHAEVGEPGQSAKIAQVPLEPQTSVPDRAPVWTPPVQRPLIIELSPTLAELTQPVRAATAPPTAQVPADVPQYPLQTAAFSSSDPALAPQPRRSPPEIDVAGGSVATNNDPWYSTRKAGQASRTTNNNEPRS